MTDTSKSYEPDLHYGRSLYRPDFTACGKPKVDVVLTYLPEKVTCATCIDELNLQASEETTQ